MTPTSDTQEFARQFNEEEAIWRRFQERRRARHLLEADAQMPESVLDHLDWLEAERDIRITRAVAQANWLSLPVGEEIDLRKPDSVPPKSIAVSSNLNSVAT